SSINGFSPRQDSNVRTFSSIIRSVACRLITVKVNHIRLKMKRQGLRCVVECTTECRRHRRKLSKLLYIRQEFCGKLPPSRSLLKILRKPLHSYEGATILYS